MESFSRMITLIKYDGEKRERERERHLELALCVCVCVCGSASIVEIVYTTAPSTRTAFAERARVSSAITYVKEAEKMKKRGRSKEVKWSLPPLRSKQIRAYTQRGLHTWAFSKISRFHLLLMCAVRGRLKNSIIPTPRVVQCVELNWTRAWWLKVKCVCVFLIYL